MPGDTLLRHGLAARLLHFSNALVVIVLLVTGLALGDLFSERIVAALGGHLHINVTHRVLGLAFAIALAVLALALPRRVLRLLRDILSFRRTDWRWPWRFLCAYLSRRIRELPFHDGRFDPAQRAVFAGIVLSIALVSASGVYLYFWTPAFPFGQRSLGYVIRLHIVAAWVLIACLCLHIFAGSGLLRTHRGLVKAMFGNGRVPITLAHGLWPGWAGRSTSALKVEQSPEAIARRNR